LSLVIFLAGTPAQAVKSAEAEAGARKAKAAAAKPATRKRFIAQHSVIRSAASTPQRSRV
jgi:hypothetical protein